jgi:hypothetical protein
MAGARTVSTAGAAKMLRRCDGGQRWQGTLLIGR